MLPTSFNTFNRWSKSRLTPWMGQINWVKMSPDDHKNKSVIKIFSRHIFLQKCHWWTKKEWKQCLNSTDDLVKKGFRKSLFLTEEISDLLCSIPESHRGCFSYWYKLRTLSHYGLIQNFYNMFNICILCYKFHSMNNYGIDRQWSVVSHEQY